MLPLRRPTALEADDAADDCALPVEDPVGDVAPEEVIDEPEVGSEPEVAEGEVFEVPAVCEEPAEPETEPGEADAEATPPAPSVGED